MNVARMKALSWLGSLAVAGYLGWYVYGFLSTQVEESRGVSLEEQRAALDSVETPEAPKDDAVPYDEIRTAFHKMNWTGREEAPTVEEGGEEPDEVEKPGTPVSDLLDVLLTQVDPDAPDASLALVQFKDGQLEVAASKDREQTILRPGETLAAPYDHVKVDRIDVDGVRFVFTNDDEREAEVVAPLPFPSHRVDIVAVGLEGVRIPENQGTAITRNESYVAWRPAETQLIGKNQYQIGVATAARFEQDYSRILSQDVSYKPYRNPRTRQVEGLRVTRVRAGSVVAAHGISEGEVLKSINGHPVTSASEAISYVKKTASGTDTWIAVFEKQGREFTRTYKSPPPE